MKQERIAGFSILYTIVGLLAIWTMVLTIIFGLLYKGDHDQVHDIRDIRDIIQYNIDTVVDACCSDPNPNRTCQGIEPEFLCWDASTNIPALANSTGNESQQYVTCTPGTTNLDGTNFWSFGDYAQFTTDENVWFKNEAAGAAGIQRETYNVTMVSLRVPNTAPLEYPTNITLQIDIFLLGNGFGLFHMPAFALLGSSVQVCPPNPPGVPCGYEGIVGVGTGIPLSRAPTTLLRKPIWADNRKCLNDPTFQYECGPGCGNTSFIVSTTTQGGIMGDFNFDVDGGFYVLFSTYKACHQVRQAYFLYQFASV